MEIVYKKIGELKPYENNPRKNDEAVDAWFSRGGTIIEMGA